MAPMRTEEEAAPSQSQGGGRSAEYVVVARRYRPQTFEELRDGLLEAEPKADERAMGYAARMLIPLAMIPETEQAWSFPTQSRFGLADEWLGTAVPARVAPRPKDLERLVLRYLEGYGPASVADAQAWTGLRGLKPVFEALRPKLRVFADSAGRMNRSLVDLGGGLLLVPQFTLAADCSGGNRPSFSGAAPPGPGRQLFERLVQLARERHRLVEAGVFGAAMQLHLVNDGPVTIPLTVR